MRRFLLLCALCVLCGGTAGCAARPPKPTAKRVVEIRDCVIVPSREVARDPSPEAPASGRRDKLTCRCDDPVVSEQVDARSGEVKRIAQCKNEKEKTK